MALQVFISKDVQKRQGGGTLTLGVRIFAEGADPVGDPEADPPVLPDDPLFEDTASADIRAKAGERTQQELVDMARNEAGKLLLDKVKVWIKTEEYEAMVDTAPVKSNIVAELAG